VPTLTFSIAAPDQQRSVFAGEWQAEFPGQTTIDLKAHGTSLTGTVKYVIPALSGSVEIYDGRIDGGAITFKVTSPNGGRTITFTGTIVSSDEMMFRREVEVPPGGGPGGAGIFGALGARTFTAKKVN
jgi:hypothetical protein